ncbi:uncharacterized protein LOC135216799 [Macrobrachium nipponense]|uniref:uncharacterized protein LOC135216799 n=1 Tax=Macrobrachium nipponense TaxID=159736 RepID=UPI0030C7BAA6
MKLALVTVALCLALDLVAANPSPSGRDEKQGGFFLHGIGLEKLFGILHGGVGGNGGKGYKKKPRSLEEFLKGPLFPLPDYYFRYRYELAKQRAKEGGGHE